MHTLIHACLILEGLTRIAPQHRAIFGQRRLAFLGRLDEAMARWSWILEGVKGGKLVVYHNDWVYVWARFGLTQVGTVEERPGLPPSPGHLTPLIRLMKDEGVKAIVVEPWSDQTLTARVAEEAGAKMVVLNAKLGAVSGPDAYIASTDANLTAVAEALR